MKKEKELKKIINILERHEDPAAIELLEEVGTNSS